MEDKADYSSGRPCTAHQHLPRPLSKGQGSKAIEGGRPVSAFKSFAGMLTPPTEESDGSPQPNLSHEEIQTILNKDAEGE